MIISHAFLLDSDPYAIIVIIIDIKKGKSREVHYIVVNEKEIIF